MLTPVVIASLQTHLMERIKYGCYVVDGEPYFTGIEEVQSDSNGNIWASFVIDHKSVGNGTVKQVQLRDKNRAIVAYKDVSITRQSAQEGVLFRFRITLTQP